MYTEYHGGSVAGGTFPAEIWGDYMKQVKGGFCGEFPPPKHPATFSKFFGKYSSSGSSSDDDSFDPDNPYATPTPAVPGTTPATPAPSSTPAGGGTGGQGYDPALYESPPQQPPADDDGH
jgi:penicillin-binding protein 1A